MSRNFDLLSQIEAEFGNEKSVRAVRPKSKNTFVAIERNSLDEQLVRLAQSVFLSNNVDAPHVVVLCGVDQENESSQICFELGRILARCSNQPVCIVDGDARAQRLSRSLDIPRPSAHAGTRGSCRQSDENLWVATANLLDPADTGALASTSYLKKSVADLRHAFDFVLIDAPGVTTQADAISLGQLADAAILVIEANSTRKAAALQAKKAFETMNVRLLGVVLNKRTYPIPEKLYRRL